MEAINLLFNRPVSGFIIICIICIGIGSVAFSLLKHTLNNSKNDTDDFIKGRKVSRKD
jgi:hypothetical protein